MGRNNTSFKKHFKQLNFDESLLDYLTDKEKSQYREYLTTAVRIKLKHIRDPYEWLDKKESYMNFNEIAKQLNITPSCCKAIYQSAIKKLNKISIVLQI